MTWSWWTATNHTVSSSNQKMLCHSRTKIRSIHPSMISSVLMSDCTWTKVIWNSCFRGKSTSRTNPSTRDPDTFSIWPSGLYDTTYPTWGDRQETPQLRIRYTSHSVQFTKINRVSHSSVYNSMYPSLQSSELDIHTDLKRSETYTHSVCDSWGSKLCEMTVALCDISGWSFWLYTEYVYHDGVRIDNMINAGFFSSNCQEQWSTGLTFRTTLAHRCGCRRTVLRSCPSLMLSSAWVRSTDCMTTEDTATGTSCSRDRDTSQSDMFTLCFIYITSHQCLHVVLQWLSLLSFVSCWPPPEALNISWMLFKSQ